MLHADTETLLNTLSLKPPHAALLAGPRGVAMQAAFDALKGSGDTLEVIEPQLLTKASTVPRISVDAIRELQLATRGQRSSAAYVVIWQADTMTVQAQNSFLKLLEEPPQNIHFVLITHAPQVLLSTVRSRVQQVPVMPVTDVQSEQLLDTLKITDSVQRRQMLFMASGLPDELTRLAKEKKYFNEQSNYVRLAKQMLEGSMYSRLVAVQQQKLTRSEALKLLDVAIRMIEKTKHEASISRLPHLLKAVESIHRGGSVKLQLALAVVY